MNMQAVLVWKEEIGNGKIKLIFLSSSKHSKCVRVLFFFSSINSITKKLNTLKR
jgi:hypothetical protein